MRGGPAGRGARGGPGGIDMIDGPSEFRYFRKNDSGSNSTGHVYPVGMRKHNVTNSIVAAGDITLLTPGGAGNGDMLYAFPEVFPRNFKVTRLCQVFLPGATPADANNLMRMGIYNDSGAGNPYPKDLLFDSGNMNIGVVGQVAPDFVQKACAVGIPGGSLVWFTIIFHATAVANTSVIYKQVPEDMFIILPPNIDDLMGLGGGGAAPQQYIGWRHARTFGALPSQFPSSAPIRIPVTTSPSSPCIPCIFYGGQVIG